MALMQRFDSFRKGYLEKKKVKIDRKLDSTYGEHDRLYDERQAEFERLDKGLTKGHTADSLVNEAIMGRLTDEEDDLITDKFAGIDTGLFKAEEKVEKLENRSGNLALKINRIDVRMKLREKGKRPFFSFLKSDKALEEEKKRHEAAIIELDSAIEAKEFKERKHLEEVHAGINVKNGTQSSDTELKDFISGMMRFSPDKELNSARMEREFVTKDLHSIKYELRRREASRNGEGRAFMIEKGPLTLLEELEEKRRQLAGSVSAERKNGPTKKLAQLEKELEKTKGRLKEVEDEWGISKP